MNTTTKILRDLLNGDILDSRTGPDRYGTLSIAQHIRRLRAQGLPIKSRLITFTTPLSLPAKYAEYYIRPADLPRLQSWLPSSRPAPELSEPDRRGVKEGQA
ncbi:hypothetical protein [Candidatus Methylocalor cossyra]|uniref:Uncharacterized protein n=1 Tax=Candidatus Methylocalor cossyra TaxID=3108543 RepID=A0ABM9NLI5_9GAMM